MVAGQVSESCLEMWLKRPLILHPQALDLLRLTRFLIHLHWCFKRKSKLGDYAINKVVCGRGSLAPGGTSFFNKKAPHIDFEIIFIDHISYLLDILCCMKYIS